MKEIREESLSYDRIKSITGLANNGDLDLPESFHEIVPVNLSLVRLIKQKKLIVEEVIEKSIEKNDVQINLNGIVRKCDDLFNFLLQNRYLLRNDITYIKRRIINIDKISVKKRQKTEYSTIISNLAYIKKVVQKSKTIRNEVKSMTIVKLDSLKEAIGLYLKGYRKKSTIIIQRYPKAKENFSRESDKKILITELLDQVDFLWSTRLKDMQTAYLYLVLQVILYLGLGFLLVRNLIFFKKNKKKKNKEESKEDQLVSDLMTNVAAICQTHEMPVSIGRLESFKIDIEYSKLLAVLTDILKGLTLFLVGNSLKGGIVFEVLANNRFRFLLKNHQVDSEMMDLPIMIGEKQFKSLSYYFSRAEERLSDDGRIISIKAIYENDSFKETWVELCIREDQPIDV